MAMLVSSQAFCQGSAQSPNGAWELKGTSSRTAARAVVVVARKAMSTIIVDDRTLGDMIGVVS